MKIFVKTLKGTTFEIQVKPEDTVADVKMSIETAQGADAYPSSQQMLIHQGKVLKDGTNLEENKVVENSFVVVMLTKTKSSSAGSSVAPAAKAPQTSAPTPASTPSPGVPVVSPPSSVSASVPSSAAPAPAPAPVPPPASTNSTGSDAGIYSQASSNLVSGSNLEGTIQQILDMGGGAWDRDTVTLALRAAFNNPERAVEYLYTGIPEQVEAPPVARVPPTPSAQPTQTAQATPEPTSGPNANPLNLFPQGLPNMGGSGDPGTGNLDFLRNSQQFQALRAMVQANPQLLQPMLQELGKQNPNLMRLIQEHQADFTRLINEPAEGGEGNILEQLAGAMPQEIAVTPEEHEAIERLEAMGFNRAIVLEVFFACNKNEELAANYLLDHMHEFDD